MSTTATTPDVSEGDLVTFEAPSGTTRYGVVDEVDWRPAYGRAETRVAVRTEGTRIWVDGSDLAP
jgi:hypothetical protein